MKQVPAHCHDCTWLFSKMGACTNPQVSVLYSYISFLPYLMIFCLIGVSLIKRKLSTIRLTSTLIAAYIIGDKLLKNIFQSERPEFSCKNTYGMPSSHMTVMAAVTFYILGQKDLRILVKIGMIALCFLQGFARVNLYYHTWEQVWCGVLFGPVFCFFFFKFFDFIWLKANGFFPIWLNITDDMGIAWKVIEKRKQN